MSSFGNAFYIPGLTSAQAVSHFGRIRLGEIFIIHDNAFEFVCFHCSQGFHDFGDFTSHAHEHLRGIGSSLVQPDKMSKRKTNTERLKDEDNEIDSHDIFAGIDMHMDNSNDSDAPNASEEFADDDDGSVYQPEPVKSYSIVDDDIVTRLAKQNFELDDSPEAEEYSRFIYDHRFRCVKGLFRCPKCSHTTNKHSHMRRHIFSHLRRKIFKCTLCSIRLSNVLHLRQHHRFHQEEKLNEQKPIPIDSIDDANDQNMETDQFREVKRMLRTNGIEVKNTPDANEYLRYLCGRNVVTKANGKFNCPKCQYSSGHPNHIKRHFPIHFKSKLFTCMKCLKKIGNVEDCRKHIAFVHGMQMERFNFTSLDVDADDSLESHPNDGETSRACKNYDSKNSIQCEVCGQAVVERDVEAHMRECGQ